MVSESSSAAAEVGGRAPIFFVFIFGSELRFLRRSSSLERSEEIIDPNY
jgi:hypothetical protein